MSPNSIEIPTLLTERLRLRSFRGSDVDDYAAMNADPEVQRHMAGGAAGPWDRGRSWRHMAFIVGHWQLKGCGPWAVELKRDGTFVGTVGFYEPDGWPGFELAGCLARRWWGNGYATEAARAALDQAFTVWKRDRVISLVNPEKPALDPGGRAPRRAPGRPHRSRRPRDAGLRHRPGNLAEPAAAGISPGELSAGKTIG